MERWSNEHRAFVIETFFKSGDSVIRTQRLFRQHFGVGRNDKVPSRKSITRWVQQFRGTASAANKTPPGRPRTVRTPENIARVTTALVRSPTRSVRRHSQVLNISDRSVRRILHLDLKFHPYKLQVVQQLLERDLQARQTFCTQLLEMIDTEPDFLNNFMMSDEAHFHLSGYVNKQNCRYWAPTNPNQIHERPLHSEKVTVWCGVSSQGILGPYFFDNDAGQPVTVTSHRYVFMLQHYVMREMRRKNIHVEWFQQDGATAHTARTSMAALRTMFPQRLVSRFGDVNWPARSPDLAACDYFLWGFLKSKVYANRPRTIQDLKNNIHAEIEAITGDTLRKVMANLRVRAEDCIANNGGHLKDIIYKK